MRRYIFRLRVHGTSAAYIGIAPILYHKLQAYAQYGTLSIIAYWYFLTLFLYFTCKSQPAFKPTAYYARCRPLSTLPVLYISLELLRWLHFWWNKGSIVSLLWLNFIAALHSAVRLNFKECSGRFKVTRHNSNSAVWLTVIQASIEVLRRKRFHNEGFTLCISHSLYISCRNNKKIGIGSVQARLASHAHRRRVNWSMAPVDQDRMKSQAMQRHVSKDGLWTFCYAAL